MKKQNYKKLTDAIKLAVPGIMELGFGCKIQRADCGKATIIKTNDNKAMLCWDAYEYSDGTNWENIEEIDKSEIIGRDINLEDCIKAYCGRYSPAKEEEWRRNASELCYGNKRGWIYGKPLHLQSDETKQFLADLIC